MRKVGAFTMEQGTVSGPADYMAARGHARLRRIEAGDDVVFNDAVSRGVSGNVETAVLGSLQAAYAAYLGEQEMLARQERARASQAELLAWMAAQRRGGCGSDAAAYGGGVGGDVA